MINFEIKNLNSVLKSLQKISITVQNEFRNKEYITTKKIFDDSQKLVPVDTGKLKKSGKVSYNKNGASTVEYKNDYAVFVHEDLNANHKKGTQAKFLEIPFIKHTKKLKKDLGI